MIDPTAYVLFLGASLVLLLTPGPAVLYIVARSVEQGRLGGLVSVLGVGLGNFAHVVAAAVGVSALIAASAFAFSILKYLGAAYLIWLGIRTLRAQVAPVTLKIEGKPLRRLFSEGAVVAALNPKTALFFLAFLPQFISPAAGAVWLQILLLGCSFVLLGLATDGLYALAAGSLRDLFRNSVRVLKTQKLVSGTVYIGLGLMTALAGNQNGK
ncbi:MAG: RhtB family transporter [Alphaproteobacteria bacterium]|nr:MAG: RhtB family transporter [Alphaproteobacteria bacterium]